MQGVIIIIINKEEVGTWGAGEAGRGRHSGWEGRGRKSLEVGWAMKQAG